MDERKARVIQGSVLFVVMLSLLLLGWGFDGLGVFFVHPARAGYVVMALVGWAIVLLSRFDVDPFRKGQEPVGKWLMRAWALTGFLLLWFVPFGDRRGLLTFTSAGASRYLGLVLC